MVLLAHIAIQVSWKPHVAKIKPVMLPLNVQLMKMIPQVKYNNYFDKADGTTGTYCYTGIMEASGCKDKASDATFECTTNEDDTTGEV